MLGISKQYPAVRANDDVTLIVAPGEIHAVLGENGAGKSTLMKILSGVITDYDGQIILAGRSLALTGTRDAEHLGINIIHQELNLIPQLTVMETLFLGREPSRFGIVDNANNVPSPNPLTPMSGT